MHENICIVSKCTSTTPCRCKKSTFHKEMEISSKICTGWLQRTKNPRSLIACLKYGQLPTLRSLRVGKVVYSLRGSTNLRELLGWGNIKSRKLSLNRRCPSHIFFQLLFSFSFSYHKTATYKYMYRKQLNKLLKWKRCLASVHSSLVPSRWLQEEARACQWFTVHIRFRPVLWERQQGNRLCP